MHRPNPQPGKPATMNNEPRQSIQDKANPPTSPEPGPARPSRQRAGPPTPGSTLYLYGVDKPLQTVPATAGINHGNAQATLNTGNQPTPSSAAAANIPDAPGTRNQHRGNQPTGDKPPGYPRNRDPTPIHNRPKIRPSRRIAPPETNHRAGNTAGNRNTPHTGINRRVCTSNTKEHINRGRHN